MSGAIEGVVKSVGGMEYTVVRSGRSRRIRMAVYPDGSIVVRCPPSMPESRVDRFVSDNRAWLSRNLEKLAARPSVKVELRDGAEIPLFGTPYTAILDGSGTGAVDGSSIHFGRVDAGMEREVLFDFYRRELEDYLSSALPSYELLTGLHAASYRVREYRSRWGSCSPGGVLSFNLKLAAFDRSIIDYVVVHELCHLKHSNHSGSFWRLVGRYLDGYEGARKALREAARYHQF